MNPMGLKVKIPFKDATADSKYLMAKYEVFKGPRGDLILDGDKMTFVKDDTEEKQRRQEASKKLIDEIQDYYQQGVTRKGVAELSTGGLRCRIECSHAAN